MKDENAIKVNSFGKKYHSYANAFKGKINETKDSNQIIKEQIRKV